MERKLLKIVLRFVFEQLSLNRLQLEVFSHNLRGIKAYKKSWFCKRRNLTSIFIL